MTVLLEAFIFQRNYYYITIKYYQFSDEKQFGAILTIQQACEVILICFIIYSQLIQYREDVTDEGSSDNLSDNSRISFVMDQSKKAIEPGVVVNYTHQLMEKYGLSFSDQEKINAVIQAILKKHGKVDVVLVQALNKNQINKSINKVAKKRTNMNVLVTRARPIDKVKEPVIHELMAKIEEL